LPLSARFSYFLKSGSEEQQQSLEAAACLWADEIVTPSRFAARSLSLVQSISQERIRVAPLAVTARKRSVQKDSNPPLLATVGRMTQQKGWDQFIDVVARLKRLEISFRVAVVGDGPWRREIWCELEDIMGGKGIEKFAWIDPVHDLPYLLGRSSVYLQLSSYESFGLAALEAAAGKSAPVISAVGPFRELFQEESGATLIEPGRTDLATEVTAQLLTAPSESKRRGELASAHAARFSWEAHLEAIESCFEQPRMPS
jgi:glycosyltransferase involved in cell wall biosynthesis